MNHVCQYSDERVQALITLAIGKLNVYARLDKLEGEVKAMTATQQDLDTAVSNLQSQVASIGSGISQLNSDWEALKAKLANQPAAADFQSEVDAINKVISDLQASASTVSSTDSEVQADGGTAPAPAPASEPAAE